ncbi:hypothetical protein WR25_10290 [Diploscapter pachys]|uniref:Uncharacterized protein n=1 Tax=Diploscapter pachys TaxID=2018661 RepID=A0A2A2JEC3_9BILA|nr:hypothetical protein WR25_10290 [Diploscapter pachys]
MVECLGLSEDRVIGMNVTGWAVFPDDGFSRSTGSALLIAADSLSDAVALIASILTFDWLREEQGLRGDAQKWGSGELIGELLMVAVGERVGGAGKGEGRGNEKRGEEESTGRGGASDRDAGSREAVPNHAQPHLCLSAL